MNGSEDNVIDFTSNMPGMKADRKIYVEVNERRDKNGRVFPLSLLWEDGKLYNIDNILDIRRAASIKTGGVGMRYTVKVKNKQTYIFFEEDVYGARWFVERKGA